MPDFDANEDFTRLPGTGQDEPAEPAEPSPPVIRRALPGRDRPEISVRRRRALKFAQRRRSARAACSLRPALRLPKSPSRRSRRLWALCRGPAPGSRS